MYKTNKIYHKCQLKRPITRRRRRRRRGAYRFRMLKAHFIRRRHGMECQLTTDVNPKAMRRDEKTYLYDELKRQQHDETNIQFP